jgi:hypothetical protein
MKYEDILRAQLRVWEKELMKPPGLLERGSKAVSRRINAVIPRKIQQMMTAAVKGIVRSVLLGVEFMPKGEVLTGRSLEERDREAENLISLYKKIAAAEGAGTGAGGLLLGAADFPALLAIKMKFLYELAHLYGFSTRIGSERLFILHIFQLAFSSPEVRPALLSRIKQWNCGEVWPGRNQPESIDWEQFQREYRDSIDFRKMLQLVPGIGAVVGAWANYGLLEDLGRTGMNCYRLRILAPA